MSWRKDDSRTERGYHHGNLKEALLQAALGLIAEKGPAGFTFADAARSAGVSPAAPYRHFRDRAARFRTIRGGAYSGLGRWSARHRHGVRAGRQGLSCVRARGAGVLFG